MLTAEEQKKLIEMLMHDISQDEILSILNAYEKQTTPRNIEALEDPKSLQELWEMNGGRLPFTAIKVAPPDKNVPIHGKITVIDIAGNEFLWRNLQTGKLLCGRWAGPTRSRKAWLFADGDLK